VSSPNWTSSNRDRGNLPVAGLKRKIAAAKVTVHERDVIDGRGIRRQPLRRSVNSG